MPTTHEHQDVAEFDVGNKHMRRVVRDTEQDGVRTHEEQTITDQAEDNFHKEVTRTTTTTPAGECHVKRVTTDKEVNGEHIRTVKVSEDGAEGHTEKDVTIIKNPGEFTTIIDKDVNGEHVHAESTHKKVNGVEVHRHYVEKDHDDADGHTKNVVRDYDAGNVHIHEETTTTEKPEDNFRMEVTNKLRTAADGQQSVLTHVTTDKYIDGEHIHKEMIEKAGADGHTVQDVTVIQKGDEVRTIIDKDKGNTQVHAEVTEKDVGGLHVHEDYMTTDKDIMDGHSQKVVRNVDAGCVHVHEEQTITDLRENSQHREEIHTTTTTPAGESHMKRVKTDREVGDALIHTETIDRDGVNGHSEHNMTIVRKGAEVTTIIDSDAGDVQVHKEISDNIVDNVPIHTEVVVRDEQTGDDHVTTVLRDEDVGKVHIHEEQTITDTRENSQHREETHTTTITPAGESYVKHVTTDREVDGEVVHTDMIDREGVNGHSAHGMTTIRKGNEVTTVIDNDTGNVQVHKEINHNVVGDVQVHTEVVVRDEQKGTDHITMVQRDEDVGKVHIHEEQTITDKKEDNFHKEVTDRTTATPSGVTHMRRVVRDRDVAGEHIHTDRVDRDGVNGESMHDVTVITTKDACTTIIDEEEGNVHVHAEVTDKHVRGIHVRRNLVETDTAEQDGHTKTIVRDLDVGKVHIHEEQTITDKAEDNYHKEVSKKMTTTPSGETYVKRVTTDRDVNGEHIHTEMVERDGVKGHTVQDVTVIKSGEKCTTVIDKDTETARVHAEVTDKVVNGVKVHEDVLETDKEGADGAHVRKVVHNADVGNVLHVHEEQTITDRDEGNFREEVVTKTTTAPSGEATVKRVTTDEDVDGEHIHTEVMEKDGTNGHLTEDVTVINGPTTTECIVHRTANGKSTEGAIIVTDEVVDGAKVRTVQRTMLKDDVSVQEGTTVVDKVEDGAVIHEEHVDKSVNGEQTHTDTVTTDTRDSCTVVRDVVEGGVHVHEEFVQNK